MKAMIFAAGLGTRLYPITKDKPKALAEVAGKTLLQRAIEYVSSYGFNDIIINTHHFASKVEDFLATAGFGDVKITTSFENELLDTAGGLAKAAGFFGDEDFLLYNVDIVTDLNLSQMLAFHRENDATVTLAVKNRKTSRYLLFDDKSMLCGWRNKSTGDVILVNGRGEAAQELAFSGIHIVSPRILPLLGEPRKQSLIPFYLKTASSQKIMAYQMPDNRFWFDCGKPETIKACQSYLSLL
jgi:NDP-sugar pyrophosphorylase family protein